MPLDLEDVRARFPGLSGDVVLLDNAGGAQVATPVIDRMTSYLRETNVQLGADYATSVRSSARVDEGRAAMARLVRADADEIVLGASTTLLLKLLAQALAPSLEPGDEVIVTDGDHESNIGPWLGLEQLGVVPRWWRADPVSGLLRLEDLDALLCARTRLVCVHHVSNLIGSVVPIEEVTRRAHAADAQVIVDGVAFAPHRRVDVRALDVDWYAFSTYKVFGPHGAVLFGRRDRLAAATSMNHFFVGEDAGPSKLEPGNPSYEVAYAGAGVVDYLEDLGRRVAPHGSDALDDAFAAIEAHETALAATFLAFLESRTDVRVLGERRATPTRVPTISFAVDGVDASTVVRRVDPHGLGIRHGHFYAKRLVDAVGLADVGGVVRVSMVHYNTVEEVERLIDVLDRVL